MNLRGINRVIVAVKDIEKSKAYYAKVQERYFLAYFAHDMQT